MNIMPQMGILPGLDEFTDGAGMKLGRSGLNTFAMIVACLSAALPAGADEGMWQPAQLPELREQLSAAGFSNDPAVLADLTSHPMAAVIGFGFCTASFVSPQGLLVTNHHCGYGAIQHNSTPENNLLEAGFLAATWEEELLADPNMRVYVTEAIQDVTARVQQNLHPGMTGLERFDAIDAAKKAMVAECEEAEGYRCDVYTFYGGSSFQLIKQMEIRDVRLVYAPRLAIGRFGDEEDNWQWPRHTGDFTFFRAYVGPDGKPADYAEDNKPFAPQHHLELEPRGLQVNDFAMAIGYPGSTRRYRLSTEVDNAIAWSYPVRIEEISAWRDIYDAASENRPAAAIKYASLQASLGNALKNYQGMLDGFARADVVAEKAQQERALAAWIEADKTRSSLYVETLDGLKTALARQQSLQERDYRYSNLTQRMALLKTAMDLYRLAREKTLPDREREAGFQERDLPRIQGRLERLERTFDAEVDQALARHLVRKYADLPASRRLLVLDSWFDLGRSDNRKIDAKLAQMYAGTELGQLERRLYWFNASASQFEDAADPFIQLAVALADDDLRLEKERKARRGEIQRLRSDYMQARLEWSAQSGKPAYDDANNSLRVTFGTVTGYNPADGIRYTPFTTLGGLAAKHTGAEPFNVPPAQLEAISAGRLGSFADDGMGTVPVNFLTSLDVTSGNSGSPTLNAEGKLVGLVFDGNYEAINADWAFNPALTRTIHVDVRYMLWVMEVIDNANHLLRELGVASPSETTVARENTPNVTDGAGQDSPALPN